MAPHPAVIAAQKAALDKARGDKPKTAADNRQEIKDQANAALAKLGLRSKDSAVVTCSYCLTMIPAWRAAVDAMLDLLVDDGALCLIDFTQRFDRASTLAERVYKAWFGLDGVYFNRDQVDYVAARTAPEYYAEARSRVPYTPWYPTRYLFAGRKEA